MATKERKPNKLVVWLKDHPMPACVIVLSLIALIAGLLLGGVNQLTYQSPEEKLAKTLARLTQATPAGQRSKTFRITTFRQAILQRRLRRLTRARQKGKTFIFTRLPQKDTSRGLN